MNQTMETIKNRRSVRKYSPEQIKDDELENILEAAIYAPTGHYDQPWHFTIIQNQDIINEINEGAKEAMKQMEVEWISRLGSVKDFNIFHGAPTVIIVSGRKDATTPLKLIVQLQFKICYLQPRAWILVLVGLDLQDFSL